MSNLEKNNSSLSIHMEKHKMEGVPNQIQKGTIYILLCPNFNLIARCMNTWIFGCQLNSHYSIIYWQQPPVLENQEQPDHLWIIYKNMSNQIVLQKEIMRNELLECEHDPNDFENTGCFLLFDQLNTECSWSTLQRIVYENIEEHIEKEKYKEPKYEGLNIRIVYTDETCTLKDTFYETCLHPNLDQIHSMDDALLENIKNYFVEPFELVTKTQHEEKNMKLAETSISLKIKKENIKTKDHNTIQKFKQFISQYSRMARCKILDYSEYMLLEVLMSAYTKTSQLIKSDNEFYYLKTIIQNLNEHEIMHLMSVFAYQLYFKHEYKIKEWESQHHLYIVFDTNILIDLGKSKIEPLIPIFRNNNVKIVIPNVVMQEIDQIKTKNDPVSKVSRDVSSMMYKDFNSHEQNVFYLLSSYIKGNKQFTNDDIILRETIEFQKQKKVSLVILITSDRNLLVKCMSKKITCMNRDQFLSFIEIIKIKQF